MAITQSASPKDWIAVLGGATAYTEEQVLAAYEIGREIAKTGKNVLTGATTGVPYAAALGAKESGALVIGISPAKSAVEHVEKYQKPLDATDAIIYSGLSCDGRSPLLTRSAGGCIFVGGEFGTLNEFTSAFMNEGKVLGVLTGMGGVSDHLEMLVAGNRTSFGANVVYDNDPVSLVGQVCRKVDANSASRIKKQDVEAIGKDVRAIISRNTDQTAPKR